MRRGLCGVLLTLGLVGCIPILEPPYPEGRLRVWWMLVEACAHRQADYDRWTFVVAPYTGMGTFQLADGAEVWAVTLPDKRLIVLSARAALCPKIVRHEMLHAIEPRYDATHPDSIYEKCDGLVTPQFSDARDC